MERADKDRMDVIAADLQTFYDERERRLAWLDEKPNPRVQTRAHGVIRALHDASRHGLDPEHYRISELEGRLASLEQEGASTSRGLYELDAELTAALLHYGSHLLRGRVAPGAVPQQWHSEPREADLAKLLQSVLESNPETAPEAFLAEVTPPHEGYRELVDLLERWRTLADEGGRPQVPDGPLLEQGDTADAERLDALTRRLRASGDLEEPASASSGATEATEAEATEATSEPIFDAKLAEALRRFQARHGIRVDGIVGPNTLAALNVPVEDRIRQIRMNLERWRWLPADFGDRYVHVNTAAQELTTYDGDRSTQRMAVVVGKEGWRTPVFTDEMERVVLHPYWNVPQNIVRSDLLPKLRENRSYLQENDFEVLSGWGSDARVLDPAGIDWSTVDLSEIRVRQRPGPGNSLGQIKFLFPNDFNVYLHDTPAQQLFDEPDRARSHGCVRVERPVDLAGFVFAETEGWDAAKTRNWIERSQPRRHTVELDRDLPVYMLYWTAFQDDQGRPHFVEDIYGYDEALARVLENWRADLPQPSSKEAATRR